jgi:hypothetical protein
MTNTPATLTQYFQHLLEKEENREKFNATTRHLLVDHNKVNVLKNENGSLTFNLVPFNFAVSWFQKEIIRIALLSLVEFQKETITMYPPGMRLDILLDDKYSGSKKLTGGVVSTLAQKYGSMLYDKSIEEIDEIFKSENICI